MPKNPARRSGPAPNRKDQARPILAVRPQKRLTTIASKESMRGTKLPHQERTIKQASSETNHGPAKLQSVVRAGACDLCQLAGSIWAPRADVCFRIETARASCGKTDQPTGDYEIEYPVPDGSAAESDFECHQVIVCDTADRQLAVSETKSGVASTRTIDVGLPASERGPSEYERYLVSPEPYLKGYSLAELDGGEKDQDLTYLSGVSGVPRDRLDRLVAAEKMACGLAPA